MATARRTLDLVSLGSKHVRNALSEELYLRTGRDVTRPASIFAEVVERCNYKCRYCDYWRRPNYRQEMTIEEWQRALSSLKEFIGGFHVEFAGGEPYIKKGFLDLLRFCRDNDIHWGVTTNGGAYLNKKIVTQTVEARPFNINISIDSMDPKIHNYSRGVENSECVAGEMQSRPIGTPRVSAISGVIFAAGNTPPWPGFAPCDSFTSIIFT